MVIKMEPRKPQIMYRANPELLAWARQESERRCVAVSLLIDRALARFKEYVESGGDEL